MKKLSFTKMQGLGNDFIVINAIKKPFRLTKSQIRQLADRHLGVGCDQILVIGRANKKNVDFSYRIFNADGSEVSQCGNGARCIAKYIHEHGLSKKKEITVATKAGKLQLKIEKNNQFTVNMGVPEFTPEKIPFNRTQLTNTYTLNVAGQNIEISAVALGNPHAVIIVNSVATAPVQTLGAQIETHADFPERVNVGFMEIVDRKKIRLRVFERGAGETLACGSGACAAVAIGIMRGLLDNKVSVELPGGKLQIAWQGQQTPLFMSGPAEEVFTGDWLASSFS